MIKDIILFVISLIAYVVLFIIPIFVYLKSKHKVNPLEYLKLTGECVSGVKIGVLVSGLFIIMLIIKNSITGWKTINFNIGVLWLSVIVVGIIEEIPFRGFILQGLWKYMNFWQANILTTVIFVAVHIPIWQYSHVSILSAAMTIPLGSLAFGYLFKEYKSLWPSIICHSVFDLCIWTGLA